MPLTMRTITAREWAPDGTAPLEGKFIARIAQGATRYLGQGILDGRREWRTNGGVATILLPDSAQAGLDPDPYYILTFRPFDKDIPERKYGPFLLTANTTLDQLPTVILELAPPGSGGGTGTPGTLTDAEIQTLITQSRDRANHNGVNDDPVGTVFPDFAEAVQDAVASMLVSGANVTLSYNDATGSLNVSATGGGAAGADPETVRDTIGAALVGLNGVGIAINDAADTITLTITGVTIAQVTGLQAALDLKAPKASPAFTGTATLNGTSLATATDVTSATVDTVKSKAGVGGFVLIRDGIDTPTPGATNELVIAEAAPGSGPVGIPYTPGLDVLGGQVACTLADPAGVITPAAADTEASGTVLVAAAGVRVAARFTVQDVVINKVTWQTGEGSTAGVSGTIGICRPDGTILRQVTLNLTPATVTAGTGDIRTWDLVGAAGSANAPLTDADLNVGDELIIFAQHATGVVRYFARGTANVVNPDTVNRLSGSLHRSGSLTAAPAVVSPLAFGTGYAKKPVPFFLFSRNI